MEYKSFFSEAGGAEGTRCNYPTRLDTYGRGCQHDCSYCYAKSLLSFRGLWNAESPSKADLRKVLHKVSEIPKGSVIRLGGMTDCFMAMEAEHHITYETIKAMNRRGIHQLIVTKSPLISTDEYLEILDPELAHIQISITSTDEELSRKYEKAPSPIARMRSAEKLSELGFDVSLRLSPYLAQYVDLEVLGGGKCG